MITLDSTVVSLDAYMKIKLQQGYISLKERVAIIDWMQQFCAKKKLQRLTFSLALILFDKVVNALTAEDLN